MGDKVAKQNYSLVIVAGAGASKEAGFPTGYELKDRIATALKTRLEGIYQQMICENHLIEKALSQICQKQADLQQPNINSYHSACTSITNAMPLAPSIDNFIDAHRLDPKITICGKLGIAYCILSAESESIMRVNNQNINNTINFQELEETWYNSLFHLIVDGCQLEDIPNRLSRIAIITFNYDRCIEHYLHHSLRRYYPQIEPEQATKWLESLKIYHPYGYLGSLPWTNQNFDTVSFGEIPNTDQLISIASRLKTFTEGTDDKHSDIIEIRSTIRSAERVVFLGFAFGEQNLELLYGGNKPTTALNTPVYATAHGLSENNIQVIKNKLHDISGHQPPYIHIRYDLTCVNLLREYGRSLKIR